MGAMDHFVWDVNPEILELGPLKLRWYGLCFVIAFWLGFRIVRSMYRREEKPESDLDALLIYAIVGTVVGARLGHCLLYEPSVYLANPLAIFKVWEGGLASHGGVLGVAIALWIFCRKRPTQPYLWLLDRASVSAALAASFIRIGNLFNSEILGKPSDVSWAVVFARVDTVPRHPAMLYEALAYFAIFALLYAIYRKAGAQTRRGLLVGLLLTLVFSARFAIEFVKERQVAFEEGLPLDMGQILSIPAILFGIWLVMRSAKASPSAP